MLRLTMVADSAPVCGRLLNEWRDDRGSVCAKAYAHAAGHSIEWRGAGFFCFDGKDGEVRLYPEPGADPDVIRVTFERQLQPVILQAMGWQVVHASGVIGPAGAMAFCGRSHSGKSTLAYAMRRAGARQFADDAVVLKIHAGGVVAHPLPFAPRLRTASFSHFADAPARSEPVPVTADTYSLVAVFVLHQDSATCDPRIDRIAPSRAFLALLEHAHCFDPGNPDHARQLSIDYMTLASEVPVFSLRYRPDFERLSSLLAAVTEAVASAHAATASTAG